MYNTIGGFRYPVNGAESIAMRRLLHRPWLLGLTLIVFEGLTTHVTLCSET
jgi:hypothetical protein